MYKYKVVISFIFIILVQITAALSQESVLEPATKDTAIYNYNRIMLIPFNPMRAYMSTDGTDREVAKYNKRDVQEIRTLFRLGLSQHVNLKIITRYDSKSLGTDNSQEAKKDLDYIYNSIDYKYDAPATEVINEEGKKIPWYKFKEKKLKELELAELNNPHATSKYKKPEKATKYMNVVIRNKDVLNYMSEKYGADLFVFINLFELKTDYEHCLDLAAKNYAREITVHFSIFDKNANQLYGDMISVVFQSNSNDLAEIIRSNFPLIGNFMAVNLPKRLAVR